mmetsp:Transcript_12258/g.26443  ORF Transcript_12258/g.26443 Transcript_12258/m.26443 type:complete len:218 (-) Transcript_12258:996-1649(-)
MMAPLAPAPAMVGKLGSMKPFWEARREVSSRSTCTSLSTLPAAICSSMKHKKSHSATASRRWASRIPASSAAFLIALAATTGEANSMKILGGVGREAPLLEEPFVAGGASSPRARLRAPPLPRGLGLAAAAGAAAAAAAAGVPPSTALRAAWYTAYDTLLGSTHRVWPPAARAATSPTNCPYSRTSTSEACRCSFTSGVSLAPSTYRRTGPSAGTSA